MPKQRCPACNKLHDVGIFVSGQEVRCSFCGLPFTVERSDSQVVDPDAIQASQAIKEAKPIDTIPKALPSDGDTAAGSDGLFIPGYEIYEMLGKGGMGRVYRARQISLDRLVAIKVLSDDLAKHRSFIRRFEKESGALAALNHTNITTVIDRGHVGNLYYFIMEYVGGPSLRQKINRELMKLDQIIAITLDLCQALDHAHERGVIHRDLKPENVLFTPDEVLKVADFGLANIVGPDKRWELTRTKVSMGTVNYMAPEQRRDAKHVDNRADIYSLGVMLYEMLVRELPLGRFDPPSSRRTDVDQRLDQLVLKMLDFEADRRPQQAKLVTAHLESIFKAVRSQAPRGRPESGRGTSSVAPEETGPAPGPALENDNQKESTMLSSADRARGRPRGLRRIPGMLLPVAGSLILLLLAAAGVVAFLLYRGLEATPGDLVLHNSEGNFQLKTSNLSLVKYLAPAQSGKQSGRQVLRFDFRPSSLPVVPVTFYRGSWQTERGRLVQDSCQDGFTVNQIPTRVIFGQDAMPPEGLELKVSLTARPSTYRAPDGREMSAEQFLQQIFGGARMLLPVEIDYRVGLGFFNRDGQGLEALLQLNGPGRLDRYGDDMEGKDHDFPATKPYFANESTVELRLTFTQGRVSLYAQDQLLLQELAGFPLEFSGLPAVACQNARCTIHSVEISSR